MTQNSQKILNFPTQQSPVNLSEKRYNKPHCILPIEDMRWVINQSKAIQQLWTECWATDPYGSRFVPFTTALAERTFKLARKVLYAAGLFEFKPEKDTSDTRKTTGWLIINLHGARRIAEFWNKTEEPRNSTENVYPISQQPANTEVAQFLPPISQAMPIEGTEMSIEGTEMSIEGTKMSMRGMGLPRISSETLANTGVSSPLSIFSGSSQELLKGVHEKKEDQAQPEALGGLPAACEEEYDPTANMKRLAEELRAKGDKISLTLAAGFERRIKRMLGQHDEADREMYIYRFKEEFKWDIPTDKLNEFMQFEPHVRQFFFDNFKSTYNQKFKGYLFGCANAFKEIIDYIKPRCESISKMIRQHIQKQQDYLDLLEIKAERLATQPAT